MCWYTISKIAPVNARGAFIGIRTSFWRPQFLSSSCGRCVGYRRWGRQPIGQQLAERVEDLRSVQRRVLRNSSAAVCIVAGRLNPNMLVSQRLLSGCRPQRPDPRQKFRTERRSSSCEPEQGQVGHCADASDGRAEQMKGGIDAAIAESVPGLWFRV